LSERKVAIREVGPRDGFQNESAYIPTELKLELIGRLLAAGIAAIEVTSFVNPKRVPQFADAPEVAAALSGRDGVELWGFAGNLRGLENAADAGLTNVTTAVAVSEEINRANFNRSTAESLATIPEFVERAAARGVALEVTVATAFGDTEGRTVSEDATLDAVRAVAAHGVTRIMLGDTVGVANPERVRTTYATLVTEMPEVRFGAHFHDTRGLGVANVLAAWQVGVRDFDSSFGGLGGCPFAPGASGNVATEELVYLFDGMGVETGIDLAALLSPVYSVSEFLGKEPGSDVARAELASVAH
jgi:hydroxymethylglutaryl-CoA lyase